MVMVLLPESPLELVQSPLQVPEKDIATSGVGVTVGTGVGDGVTEALGEGFGDEFATGSFHWLK